MSATPTPTPTTNLKRKQSNSDISPDASQSKRLRVAFNNSVQVQEYPDWNKKPIALVREEVRRALDKRVKGDDTAFDEIKNLFTRKPSAEDAPTSRLLRKYLLALTGQVSALPKSCSSLVQAVISCRWLLRDNDFVEAYKRFVGDLVSAQSGHIEAVMSNIVEQFTSPPKAFSHHPDDEPLRRADMNARLHRCLRYLLEKLPLANSALKNMLAKLFPHEDDSTKAHVDYIKNMLRIIDYTPALKGTILSLITAQLIKIDVKMQIDLEEIEEDMEENLVNDPLKPNTDQEDETDSDDESDAGSEDSDIDPEEKRIQDLRNSVSKLDTVLDLLFEYYHPIFAKSASVDIDSTYTDLMSQFTNTILPTYRSRHTQFLIFHFAQTSPRFIEHYSFTCIELLLDQQRPLMVRIAAAAYLASFVSRGAHLSREHIRDIIGGLCAALENQRQRFQPKCEGPDLRRYGAYYAIAQALLYVFCFRWRDLIQFHDDADYEDLEDLLSSGQDFEWMPPLKEVFNANVYSKFNPLKVCSPAIVAQFARIAQFVRFMYVFPLLEKNKRVRLGRIVARVNTFGGMPERQTALSAQQNEGNLQLDAYFPFDPYKLPKSKRWLEGDYVDWRPIPGLDKEEESDSEDEEEDEEEGSEDEKFEEATATETSP